jgi:hypothetical protein
MIHTVRITHPPLWSVGGHALSQNIIVTHR